MRSPRRASAYALTGLLALASITLAGAARAAVPSAGLPDSWSPSISADGQRVAFSSLAPNMVAGSTIDEYDIYVRDRGAHTTTLVSVSTAGVHANGSSSQPVISGDGDFVVFTSDASNLVAGDTNGASDLFLRDLVHHTTTRVNVTTAGVQQPGDNGVDFAPSISADGRYVVFESASSALVPGDTNGVSDIFLRDTVAGTTTRISVTGSGAQADGTSYEPSISGDGTFIAFASDADNLVAGDTNGSWNVFGTVRSSGAVSLISVASGGGAANGDSFAPSVSDTGRSVAFESAATNLVSHAVNGSGEIFVRDRTAATTTLVSVTSSGAASNGNSEIPAISGDGHAIVFVSAATNLLPGADVDNDIYRRDLVAATTTRIGGLGDLVSDVDYIRVGIDDDGNALVFSSTLDTIVAGDTNQARDVFVRTVGSGAIERVSVANDGSQTINCFWSFEDSVVGIPTYGAGAGAVDVHSASGGDALLTRSGLGAGTSSAGDDFGAAIAIDDLQNTVFAYPDTARDFTGGGCESIAIGAPGTGGAGAVFIAFSSATGVGNGHDVATLADPQPQPGEQFGASILIRRAQSSSISDVFVGAPGKNVGSATGAGAVVEFQVSYPQDADRATVTYIKTITQNSPNVVGTAETGDRFGEVLSGATGFLASSYLDVGVPHEDVGSAKDAGMVDVIPLTSSKGASGVTQNSKGMPGTAEAGDLFGAALDGSNYGGCGGTVGIPGEDIGTIRDAGAAETFTGCGSTFKAGKLIDENSTGVPGTAEAGDRFGAAIAAEFNSVAGGTYIGIPGEGIGSVNGAGAVLIIPSDCGDYTPFPNCPAPQMEWQGHNAPGSPQTNAHFGAALGARLGETDDDDTSGDMLVGAPGENAGTGAVYGGLFLGARTITLSTGSSAGLNYGAVLGLDATGGVDTN